MHFDTGIFIIDEHDTGNFVMIQYEDYFHIYLGLFDNGEPPYRDLLAEGIAPTIEEAQDIALKNFKNQLFTYMN